MKVFRKLLCVALVTSVLLAASPMITYAESETTIQKKVSITLDDTLSYIDTNDDDVINDGDIIYYGTEGFYIYDAPTNANLTDPNAKIRVLSVKKVNASTLLQDDNASSLIYLDVNTIDSYYTQYVNKLTTDYGAEYGFQSALIKKTHLKPVDGYDWVYEFNWWSRHWHNTWQMFLPAVVATEDGWIENGIGPAYLRPAVNVNVSDIVAAKNATYDINMTSQNGQINVETIADQVTITTVADEGYILDTLSVTDKNGNAITLNGSKFTMPAKDVDIKANFKKKEYTVNFNSVGGSDVVSQTLEHGDVLTTPTFPTKTNYIFDGWYCEEECTTKYDFSTPVTSSFYLYAKWIPCEHSFEWKVDVEPTATEVGLKHEECTYCGAVRNNDTEIPIVETVVVPECEHSFKWKIDVEPTVTEVGLKHEECTYCGVVRNSDTEIPIVKIADVPETGDPNNMLIYMTLMLMTGSGCVILKNYIKEEK